MDMNIYLYDLAKMVGSDTPEYVIVTAPTAAVHVTFHPANYPAKQSVTWRPGDEGGNGMIWIAPSSKLMRFINSLTTIKFSCCEVITAKHDWAIYPIKVVKKAFALVTDPRKDVDRYVRSANVLLYTCYNVNSNDIVVDMNNNKVWTSFSNQLTKDDILSLLHHRDIDEKDSPRLLIGQWSDVKTETANFGVNWDLLSPEFNVAHGLGDKIKLQSSTHSMVIPKTAIPTLVYFGDVNNDLTGTTER